MWWSARVAAPVRSLRFPVAFGVSSQLQLQQCLQPAAAAARHSAAAAGCRVSSVPVAAAGSSSSSLSRSRSNCCWCSCWVRHSSGGRALALMQQQQRRCYWAKSERELAYDSEQIESWREAFPTLKDFSDDGPAAAAAAGSCVFDLDSDGMISRADLQKRPEFSLDKVQKIERYDKDKNNLIDFGEFVEGLYELDKEILKEGFEGFNGVDVQLEFEKFASSDASGRKSLSLSGIAKLLKANKFTCITEKDCEKLFKEIDANADGVIDLSDFQQWVAAR
ncbi:hypothetical protein Esti_006479 [Eimeria stiedai]